MIWCDNLSTVAMSENPILHSRTKHIELDLYFVHEKVLAKNLVVQHVPTIDQIADILTKPVSATHFVRQRDKLSVKKPTMSLIRFL